MCKVVLEPLHFALLFSLECRQLVIPGLKVFLKQLVELGYVYLFETRCVLSYPVREQSIVGRLIPDATLELLLDCVYLINYLLDLLLDLHGESHTVCYLCLACV